MAISTLDGALAGMQMPQAYAKAVTATLVAGRPASTWLLGGAPGAGLAIANTAGGVVLSSSSALVNGQIPHYDPGSGNSYLARFSGAATQAGTLLLCDRLLQIGGNSGGSAISVTATTSQTINSTTLPARDRAGSTNGDSVYAALEVQSTMGAGAPVTLTLGYTNQSGTASRSAVNIDQTVTTSAVGAFYRFGLQAGDTGIQSIQTYQSSATMTSGTLGLIMYRVLASLELAGPFIPNCVDALTSGFPQLWNGTVPFLVFIPNTTTASNVSGTYVETQG